MASRDDATFVDAVRCGNTVFLRGSVAVESTVTDKVTHVVVIVDDNSGRCGAMLAIFFKVNTYCLRLINSMTTNGRNKYCIKKTEEIISSCRSAEIEYRYAGYVTGLYAYL
jgi:hypothetical protein